MSSILNSKSKRRQELIKTRQQMSRFLFDKESVDSSKLIIEHCSNNSYQAVLSYAAKEDELNLQHAHDFFWSKKIPLFFPKVVPGESLSWGKVDSSRDLVKGHFDVDEPVGELCRIEELSGSLLVLVPGLGFTKEGLRIGWGKGYYDKSLSLIVSKNDTTLGVGFSCQLCDSLPVEGHDVSLDKLIIAGEFVL